eukprot:9409066-Alexandrium_andersonii.AAC.1
MVDDALAAVLKDNAPLANQKVSATARAAGKATTVATSAPSDWLAPLPSRPASFKRAAPSTASARRGRTAAGCSVG